MKPISFAFLLLAISFFSTACYAGPAGDVDDVMKTPFYQKMLRTAFDDINKMKTDETVYLLIDGVTSVKSVTIETSPTTQKVHFSLEVRGGERNHRYLVEFDVYTQPFLNKQRVEDFSVVRLRRHHDDDDDDDEDSDRGHGRGRGNGGRHFRHDSF